jgi:AcrR family transcriptional regulator
MKVRRARPGPGRRPGGPDTRGEILDAARAEFAERAYDGATIRSIATRAGVDAALVHHYFGTKEQLFTAALEWPIDPDLLARDVATGSIAGLGERVTRAFLAVWADPRMRAPIVALVRSSMSHEVAAKLLRQFATRVLMAHVSSYLEDLPDREFRIQAAMAHLVGVGILRYVVELEPIASVPEDELVALVAPTIQRYLAP